MAASTRKDTKEAAGPASRTRKKRTNEAVDSGSASEDNKAPPPKKKKAPAPASRKKKKNDVEAEVIDVDGEVGAENSADDASNRDELSQIDTEVVDEEAASSGDEGQGDDEEEDGKDDGEDDEEDNASGSEQEGSDIDLPYKTKLKVELTADLMTIFSGLTKVKFRSRDGSTEVEKGRWCTICRDDEKKKAKTGARTGWYTGANSSCRRHIASLHYTEYSKRCKAAKIEEKAAATPKSVLEQRKQEVERKKKQAKQTTLDGVARKIETPTEFSRSSILDAVTKHVVVGDQALLVADTPTFTNCLVTMRPKTTKQDLPSRAVVRNNIKNSFVDYVDDIRKDIRAAPGDVSTNHDLWTEDHASIAFFGLNGQWIDVKIAPKTPPVWTLRAEVLAHHRVLGAHDGKNLGKYFIKLCDRVGITSKTERNKLGHATADNATNNDTTVEEVARFLTKRGVDDWKASERKLSCIAHVVQLGIEDFMADVTKVALVESKQAIWEYDPMLAENRASSGGLDVIAIIRTLAIKIQASPQRKEAFERHQRNCGIETPLIIPLHGNTRWGSAHGMCERAYRLRAAINSFVATADDRFGPITTIRRDGKVVKKIPWLAFRLDEADWRRVRLCADILADANKYHQLFSSDKVPTIHRVIPALESLCTRWEKKLDESRYKIFHPALRRGLSKLGKYYTKLDNSSVYILSLLLHPYYKLDYIGEKWGGEQEQQAEIAAGNIDAIDWKKYAHEVVDKKVAEYWPKRLNPDGGSSEGRSLGTRSARDASPGHGSVEPQDADASTAAVSGDESDDEYDRARARRLREDPDGGWKAELKRYLNDPMPDVKKDTDTIAWWAKHSTVYPTLARLALDILPIPASSVSVERQFSRAAEVSTDRRSRLGPDLFEWLECLNNHWRHDIVDLARLNSAEIEEVELLDYAFMYQVEEMWGEDEGTNSEDDADIYE